MRHITCLLVALCISAATLYAADPKTLKNNHGQPSPSEKQQASKQGLQDSEVYALYLKGRSYWSKRCFSSIILSPPNGNVKMSPHERKDIRVESEGTATSERNFQLR